MDGTASAVIFGHHQIPFPLAYLFLRLLAGHMISHLKPLDESIS
jgi:hypothetical protein